MGLYKFSPSGRYLLVEDVVMDQFRLINLVTSRIEFVMNLPHLCDAGFDANDQLAIASFSYSSDDSDQYSFHFWHWAPGQSEPRHVHQQAKLRPKWFFINCPSTSLTQLTADAHHWLVLNKADDQSFELALLDATTGKVVQTFDYHQHNNFWNEDIDVNVVLTQDSSQLVMCSSLLTREDTTTKVTRYSTKTGKSIGAEYVLPHRLERIIQVDNETLHALSQHDDKYHLLSCTPSGMVETFLVLNSSMAVDVESESKVLAKVSTSISNLIHIEGTQVIFGYEHYHPAISIGFSCGMRRAVQGYHLGLTKLGTSQLKTHALSSNAPPYSESWELLAIAPPHWVVLQKPRDEIAGWRKTIEDWRQNHCGWLQSLERISSRIELIDVRDGTYHSPITLPYPSVHTLHQSGSNTLQFIAHTKDEMVIYEYPIPWSKPWLQMAGWSLLCFLLLVGWKSLRLTKRCNTRSSLLTGEGGRG